MYVVEYQFVTVKETVLRFAIGRQRKVFGESFKSQYFSSFPNLHYQPLMNQILKQFFKTLLIYFMITCFIVSLSSMNFVRIKVMYDIKFRAVPQNKSYKNFKISLDPFL